MLISGIPEAIIVFTSCTDVAEVGAPPEVGALPEVDGKYEGEYLNRITTTINTNKAMIIRSIYIFKYFCFDI